MQNFCSQNNFSDIFAARMKRLPFSTFCIISCLVSCVLCLNSCKQDFDITARYKEVPVVYGLLDQSETTHYIRIQKGYLIDGRARSGAAVYDSIYYRDILTVKLYGYNNNGSITSDSFTLNRVNGNDIGLPKATGVFASDSNILYTFNGTLNANRTYKLVITNRESGKVIRSETSLVQNFDIYNPRKADKISLLNSASASFNRAGNAGIYDMKIRLHYKEFNVADNTLFKDTFVDISSPIDDNSTSTSVRAALTTDLVVGYMASKLDRNPDVYREFNIEKGIQVFVSAGGTQLATYLNSQMAQTGLVSGEALSPYTNIDGGEGLFSSRYTKRVDSVLLSNSALDSLACSSFGRGLRFKNHNGFFCN